MVFKILIQLNDGTKQVIEEDLDPEKAIYPEIIDGEIHMLLHFSNGYKVEVSNLDEKVKLND